MRSSPDRHLGAARSSRKPARPAAEAARRRQKPTSANLTRLSDLIVPAGFTAIICRRHLVSCPAFSEPKLIALGYSFEQGRMRAAGPIHTPARSGEQISIRSARLQRARRHDDRTHETRRRFMTYFAGHRPRHHRSRPLVWARMQTPARRHHPAMVTDADEDVGIDLTDAEAEGDGRLREPDPEALPGLPRSHPQRRLAAVSLQPIVPGLTVNKQRLPFVLSTRRR